MEDLIILSQSITKPKHSKRRALDLNRAQSTLLVTQGTSLSVEADSGDANMYRQGHISSGMGLFTSQVS